MKEGILKIGVLCFIFWATAGCSAMKATYGSIVPDAAAEKNFEAFVIDPGMNYYWSGPDYYPNALMGLKKEYVLDNDLWKTMEPNSVIFKKTIQNMQNRAWLFGSLQRGFVIRDPQGKPIGVWYSVITVNTMNVRMGKDNRVVIDTPELIVFTYHGGGGTALPSSMR